VASARRIDAIALRRPLDWTPKEADAPPAVMLDCVYRSSIRGSLVAVDVLDPVTQLPLTTA